ncbi:protein-L-isoaspartate O-methyltransferase [Acidovorax sp. Leaf76]|uniref:protein-L-isoaspartate(D-aspartate) O-methyltransferase n=1 Tax=unclassified Acidovorax TaxID=2684926 RepID=UPI0006F96BC9|nr:MULTISPECIES: protein-L-isoaspartate(D-aspartate) O-methyltransferase [unclassified Acidovorax]KQO25856.1 protein-L-isoaspartate O-methyltransferase [Acidovorax sp. Leaf76]KQO28705.1 protein-L-isoaspartate O-methyltransferase [Acidovorax sp. Leaf84]KQS40638.1 protein-L-isoaspartate O-methyltransferase [Acidovorax sp. Leaf191]
MQQRRPGFPARLPGTAAPTPARPAPAAPLGGRPPAPSPSGVGLDSAAVRARMVQKLAAGGITSSAVLQAMGAVQRHQFVDSALVNQAYEDTSLPIGLGQTISKPNVVARMCELLLGADIARSGGLGRVLEIGTGCGYQAAVLSHLAREVYTLERLRGLHDKARSNLRPFRLANVHLLFGDGMLGYAKGAPYAAIIAAAGGDAVPQAWCDQLAVGGRLVAPMAVAGGQQMLLVIDKTPHGLKQNVLEPVHFVPLKSGVA